MPDLFTPCPSDRHHWMDSALGTHCLYCGAMRNTPLAQVSDREDYAKAERRLRDAWSTTTENMTITRAELVAALVRNSERERLLAEEAAGRSTDCWLCGETIGPYDTRRDLAAALSTHYSIHASQE